MMINKTFRCVCQDLQDRTQHHGCTDGPGPLSTCNTTSACFQNIIHTALGEIVQKGCDDFDGRRCASGGAMTTFITRCCETDLCNHLDMVNDEKGTSVMRIAVPVIITFLVLIIIIVAIWRSKRAKTAPHSLTDCTPIRDSSDLSLVSSGCGGPGLLQRTVAKKISLQEPIGKGGYGEVWKGAYNGDTVAVKIFNSADAKSWERENHVYTTSMMRHENILVFYGADVISRNHVTQLWLITQFHELGSLFDFLTQHLLTPHETLRLALSAATGFVHLHQEVFGTYNKFAIAHGDIKSKNILVKNDLTCCIADFGLAVMFRKDRHHLDCGTNSKRGTKRYMSPEILDDSMLLYEFDAFKRSDVYSFSLVLWELAMRCQLDGEVGDYVLPYHTISEPTIENMREAVCDRGERPSIPASWLSHPMLTAYVQVVRESWSPNPMARLTMLRIKKNLARLQDMQDS